MKQVYKKMTSHGSLSIPAAMRRELGIQNGDPMELSVNGQNQIVIAAYRPRCMYCNTDDGVKLLHGKGICRTCADMIAGIMEERKES